MPDTNLSKIIDVTLENIKNITDTDTIIGKPIEASNGTTIIPVSKISMGFTSGGLDYIRKSSPDKPANFGGGMGTGVTITPMAFLVTTKEGTVSLLTVDNPAGQPSDLIGTLSSLIDKAPSLIEKVTQIFKKDKKNEPKSVDPTAILDNIDPDEMN